MINELNDFQLIDLTHSLNSGIPTWSGNCGFQLDIKQDYEEGCRVHSIKMHAGIGTHMDAPSHFVKAGISIADIPIESLIVPACVLHVSNKSSSDYMISEEDVKSYEKEFSKIPSNSLVIACTGWDKYWNHVQYRNLDAEGNMHFPGFSKKAVEILIEREIAGIGIDTLSPDGSDMAFPVHHLILGSGRYIIENLTQCDKLPPRGAYVIALPIKIQDGTEAAIRAIGLKRKNKEIT